jgi:phosphate transport system ATP-binding protein
MFVPTGRNPAVPTAGNSSEPCDSQVADPILCLLKPESLCLSALPQLSIPKQMAGTKVDVSNSFNRVKMSVENLNFYYGKFKALHGVSIPFQTNEITALIGPSGCGKSTLLRTLNRLNETVRNARQEGRILLDGQDISNMDVTNLRRRVGMVFQRPNPFPKSVFENVAYGPKIHGMAGGNMLRDLVEKSLRSAALWDEVRDRLHESAYALSGGQQQRLCVARALAVAPDILLLDEPCSALHSIATSRIEDLLLLLKSQCR